MSPVDQEQRFAEHAGRTHPAGGPTGGAVAPGEGSRAGRGRGSQGRGGPSRRRSQDAAGGTQAGAQPHRKAAGTDRSAERLVRSAGARGPVRMESSLKQTGTGHDPEPAVHAARLAGDPREVEEVAASVNDLMLSIAGQGRRRRFHPHRGAGLPASGRQTALARARKQPTQTRRRPAARGVPGMIEQLIEVAEVVDDVGVWHRRPCWPWPLFAAATFETEIARVAQAAHEASEGRGRLAEPGRAVLAARGREYVRQGRVERDRACRMVRRAPASSI